MFGYLFRRIIVILWLACVAWFISSLCMDEYYYTYYHDTKIVSDKFETIKRYDNHHHEYPQQCHTVVWTGYDINDQLTTHTTVFMDGCVQHPISLAEIKQGNVAIHHCGRTWALIVSLTILTIAIIAAIATEDDDNYTYEERKLINAFQGKILYNIFIFLGYDKAIVDKVWMRECVGDQRRILKRYDLYYLYNRIIMLTEDAKTSINDK